MTARTSGTPTSQPTTYVDNDDHVSVGRSSSRRTLSSQRLQGANSAGSANKNNHTRKASAANASRARPLSPSRPWLVSLTTFSTACTAGCGAPKNQASACISDLDSAPTSQTKASAPPTNADT